MQRSRLWVASDTPAQDRRAVGQSKSGDLCQPLPANELLRLSAHVGRNGSVLGAPSENRTCCFSPCTALETEMRYLISVLTVFLAVALAAQTAGKPADY